jgi:hypothetical protein
VEVPDDQPRRDLQVLLRVYTQHVEQYLIPHLGRLGLADVTVRHLAAMFANLAKQTT